MNRRALDGSWKVATIIGIPIRIHFSWLIVFGLITWSLSTFYFPQAAPDLPRTSYWMKGVLAALLLFASVAFHELSHSVVARRYKVSIESITLFVFGGVAQMKGEPPHPRAEFLIAIAGPLSKSLEMMVTEDKGRLAVMEKGKIIGLITSNGVARYIQIRKEISS